MRPRRGNRLTVSANAQGVFDLFGGKIAGYMDGVDLRRVWS